ncbi:hypothetical protein [Prosthecobacter sp.]|uniref:hypothetical protein n=1 Tax=Prosthecobacter sp. TaxID=1965333 RepID=UPI0037846689
MKTTILGILTIAASIIGAAIEIIKTGTCNLPVAAAGIATGWGLIHAQDASKPTP